MIRNPEAIEVLDEGATQGRARVFDFAGAGVTAAVSGQTATITIAGGGGGALTLSTAEVSLGAAPRARRAGSFQITGLSGLTTGKPVSIQQASGPYTGKGVRTDEAEMDQVLVTAKVLSTTVIQAYWKSEQRVRGNFKFDYVVGA